MSFRTFITPLIFLAAFTAAKAENLIKIESDNYIIVYDVAGNNRVYQRYLGKKLRHPDDYSRIANSREALLTHGMEDYFEPAIHINHADNNQSTLLEYTNHTQTTAPDGSTCTVISLADPVYNSKVNLCCTVYPENDVFKIHTEIINGENEPVQIEKYASALLHFDRPSYYLTQYDGDWATEANITESQLSFGKKVLDSKLGTRANMFCAPFFNISFDNPGNETSGDVLTGTLAWTGNFRFTFEVDHNGGLRLISGINPYASQRVLNPNETFITPDFVFTLSDSGTGKASRNLHDWARNHQIAHGNDDRMVLLNNWETTFFDINEQKITNLIHQAKDFGFDLFLLDDGWFGNKYPRHNDTQGLGDWDENSNIFPNGIGVLTAAAKNDSVKFGIWIEPEMVNPRSELYENHKDWVITLPNRPEYYFRNQLVLDLTNPEVQDYVFGIVDTLMTRYPDISFFKWDCNSPITNIYSNYEKNRQSHLYVDYVHGLYNVLERIRTKYPDLVMMMCSSGGGRCDYGGLEYFDEFWTSDNTDPLDRLFIQWGFSQIFPAKVLCAHVTNWNRNTSLKFRTNVAMMGKLGFDLNLSDLNQQQAAYCRQAIKNYNSFKNTVLNGDIYRLVSPYKTEHAAIMYVDKTGDDAVVFTFDISPRFNTNILHTQRVVHLQGLNPDSQYRVKEIDRPDAEDAEWGTFSGEYLMTIGLPMLTSSRMNSRVFRIEKI
ncbi:MAG: alpha-galactosidase [Muribaculaceae bacterium]|nr:alpha-galactosidase [Muribaculaceae bacterium]